MSTIIDSTSSTQPTIELNHVEEMKSIGPSQPEEVSSGSSKDNSHGDSVGGMKENKTSDENPIEQEISNGDVNTPNDVDTNSKAMLSKPYYCQICMTTYPVNDPCFNPYELSCGHIFCNDCLFQFLYSKITDGEVYPKCFMKVESILNQTGTLNQQSSMYLQSSSEPPQSMASMPDTRENSDFGTTVDVRRSNSNNFGQVLARIGSSGTSQGLRGGTLTSASHDSEVPQSISLVLHEINSHIVSKDCGQVISESDIVKLISTDTNLLDKWKRFSFFHNNPNGRECPNITCRELLLSGSAESPNMTCPKCSQNFCFLHSTAHQNQTCAEYTQSTQKETQLNSDFIEKTSRPCPTCGKRITKSGGCNHMRCVCGTAFCWLCGKQVDDSTFPTHFQWWNANGCSNMQMDPALEPSTGSLVLARVMTAFQLVIFGPLTAITSALSILLCCCFMGHLWTPSPPKPGEAPSSFCTRLGQLFSSCLTGWGIFYMTIILGIPFGVICGSIVAVLWLIYAVGYVISRLVRKQYPWPDEVTAWCRRRTNARRPPFTPPPVPQRSASNIRINNRIISGRSLQNATPYVSRRAAIEIESEAPDASIILPRRSYSNGSSHISSKSSSSSSHSSSHPRERQHAMADTDYENNFDADLARAIAESMQSHNEWLRGAGDIESGNGEHSDVTIQHSPDTNLEPADDSGVVVVSIPEEQFAFLAPSKTPNTDEAATKSSFKAINPISMDDVTDVGTIGQRSQSADFGLSIANIHESDESEHLMSSDDNV